MTDKNANTEIRKEFCPNCEAEVPCTHEAELYVCDICGEDFAKYIVSRSANVSDVSTTQEEENKSRLVYIVTMYRYGDREKHSYVLGAFSTENNAREWGEKEKDYRGGKYEPEIIMFYVDGQRIDDFVGDSDHEHDDRI